MASVLVLGTPESDWRASLLSYDGPMTGAEDWAAKLRKLIIDERDVVQADQLWVAGQGQWLAGLEKEAATRGLEGPLSTLYSVVPNMLFWLGRPAEAAALWGAGARFAARRTATRSSSPP